MLSNSLRVTVFSIVLALVGSPTTAVSGEPPVELMDEARLCKSALGASLSDWSTFGSDFAAVEEAQRRGLTVHACRRTVQVDAKHDTNLTFDENLNLDFEDGPTIPNAGLVPSQSSQISSTSSGAVIEACQKCQGELSESTETRRKWDPAVGQFEVGNGELLKTKGAESVLHLSGPQLDLTEPKSDGVGSKNDGHKSAVVQESKRQELFRRILTESRIKENEIIYRPRGFTKNTASYSDCVISLDSVSQDDLVNPDNTVYSSQTSDHTEIYFRNIEGVAAYSDKSSEFNVPQYDHGTQVNICKIKLGLDIDRLDDVYMIFFLSKKDDVIQFYQSSSINSVDPPNYQKLASQHRVPFVCADAGGATALVTSLSELSQSCRSAHQ